MSCCSPAIAETSRFFSHLARLHRLRFKVFGFETSQKQLLAGIRALGLKETVVLDIGCGPGYLHHDLLRDNSALRATGVDLSERMLTEARALAHVRRLTCRTDYQYGDFVALADSLEDADITLLDKVVCCYPDPDLLINRSTEKTRQVYALTYPRNRSFTRASVEVTARVLTLFKCNFRPYVHAPKRIETLIRDAGFTKVQEHQTFSWLTQLYRRTH